MEVERSIYWNKERGTVAPLDQALGIVAESYSVGVREMACRQCLNVAFAPASENLARSAQLTISSSALRELVQREGRRACSAIREGRYGPNWSAADCSGQTLITGADGVMVPMVTQEQKHKRRASETKKRQQEGRQSTAKAGPDPAAMDPTRSSRSSRSTIPARTTCTPWAPAGTTRHWAG